MIPAPETPASATRPLELAAQSREKNPVKVASAELARIAGDIQVVGTVAFHEDHYALVGPLVSGRISRLAIPRPMPTCTGRPSWRTNGSPRSGSASWPTPSG
jgi:hypothetical protein